MHKVSRMTQAPMQCLTCGRGNIPDDPHTMDDLWFLDLERDVNWGDPTYLCMYCCEKIGITAGLVSMHELKEVQDLNRVLGRRVHDLRAKLETKQHRLDRITGGAKALKQEKQSQTSSGAEAVDELRKRAKKRKAVKT